MRHMNLKHTLGVSASHRKMMLRNLSSDLLKHGKIKTTHTRCKVLRSYIEKLVTLAKEDTVANRRLAFARLLDRNAVGILFGSVAPKMKTRPGGYTRIVKLADPRVGDNAPISYISFVE